LACETSKQDYRKDLEEAHVWHNMPEQHGITAMHAVNMEEQEQEAERLKVKWEQGLAPTKQYALEAADMTYKQVYKKFLSKLQAIDMSWDIFDYVHKEYHQLMKKHYYNSQMQDLALATDDCEIEEYQHTNELLGTCNINCY
jgi:hypothetical protein